MMTSPDQDATQDQPDHVAIAVDYALAARPDWDRYAIEAAAELSRRHRDQPTEDQIAGAIIAAANDPNVRKPAYVPASRYWKAQDVGDTSSPADDEGKRQPHECRSCGQPGSALIPPAYCPNCGMSWDPITPDGNDAGDQGKGTLCVSCRHRQPGRFAYCSRCGATMSYTRSAPRPAEQPAEQLQLPDD